MRRTDYRPSVALAAFALGTLVAPAPGRATAPVGATPTSFAVTIPV